MAAKKRQKKARIKNLLWQCYFPHKKTWCRQSETNIPTKGWKNCNVFGGVFKSAPSVFVLLTLVLLILCAEHKFRIISWVSCVQLGLSWAQLLHFCEALFDLKVVWFLESCSSGGACGCLQWWTDIQPESSVCTTTTKHSKPELQDLNNFVSFHTVLFAVLSILVVLFAVLSILVVLFPGYTAEVRPEPGVWLRGWEDPGPVGEDSQQGRADTPAAAQWAGPTRGQHHQGR